MNKLRSFLLLLLVSTAALLAGFIYKNFHRLPSSVSVEFTGEGVDIGMKNFHVVDEEAGEKKWELKADKAEIIDSRDVTELKEARLTLYRPQEKDILVTADKGVVQNKSKNLEVTGNVVVFDGEFTLKSNKLNCESDAKLISTDEFVEIKGKNFEVTGSGMISDLGEERMEILNNVKMVMYPEKNE